MCATKKPINEKILQSLPKVHNMFLGINPLSIIQIRGVTLFRLYNMLFYMSSTYYLHTYIKYSKVKIKDLKIWFCCWTCWFIEYCSLWCFFRLYSVLPIITTYPNLRFFFKSFVPRYLYYYVHIQKAMNKYCTIAELFFQRDVNQHAQHNNHYQNLLVLPSFFCTFLTVGLILTKLCWQIWLHISIFFWRMVKSGSKKFKCIKSLGQFQ